ncbi:Trafficking protein particle complex subunit 6B [Penicillium hetheringtonii]|uniref:Trafficking protein particle complex subunit 6B n=1 Tax=Penicillium hetheringtonii TaxID=911720 RepID=A0AAD6DF04_9EURO|nr:Trafficking protein particle complex subunit 6B [Penicillium hetheringtonii]
MSFDASASLTISDPNARALSSSCFDFLLIELVPMAERIAKDLATDETEPDDEEVRESTYFRLDTLGYRVGQGLAERKQIDNLKTNHRGVYVLTDSSFRPFARMSMAVRADAVSMAQAYLWFPCGIIRGALANLGINTTVQAETSELPGATFQIKTVQARP